MRWIARGKRPEVSECLFNDATLKETIGRMAKVKHLQNEQVDTKKRVFALNKQRFLRMFKDRAIGERMNELEIHKRTRTIVIFAKLA